MPEKPPPLRRRPTAAGSWVRSLHCKSMAADDVAARVAAAPKKLLPRAGCGGSSGDTLNHVVVSSKPSRPKPKPKPKPSPEPKTTNKPKPVPVPPSPPPGPLGPVPALTELPAGHSSRQVVEIIFLSSWSSPPPGAPTSSSSTFPGAVVEMLFRVHNPARAVARFEDYRAAVRARAGGASRSAADGNEMMRFTPAPPYGSSAAAAAAAGEDGPRVRTFDGSGGAHASARGPATGRRAMFLCRVIAGRVAEGAGAHAAAAAGKEHFDSVRVGRGGELVVFDRRAVLPCFLIIYKL
ncbi:homeobox protein engrailed-1 [Zea mays]|jgi:hypothetical protein|uniref:Zinc finger (C2H2 type) family protein n=1 Tax=Zea mays TaxID=4577 RepID=A0A1D6HF57_MAIZE|nr:homeobox protein engrailed-1 [Zea mays]AQK73277.1 zinc finger (C2H2 type) family protein [Zea mays]|eukprot:XP_020393365.1 homeobox protein engrailed-1 [Zea mays]